MQADRQTAIELNYAGKVQERLQKRHQARLEDAERRKEAKESSSVAEEKVEYFSSTFYGERACIEQLLSECSGTDRAEATRRLEEATNKVQQLQKFLNDSLLFLTQYNVREAQAALQQLQNSLSETREACLPQKTFAFRTRTKAAEKSQKTELGSSNTPEAESGNNKVDNDNASAPPAPEQCGIFNLSNEFVSKTSEEISKQHVLLTHLTHCKVRLFGSPSTLHLKHIEDCEILCGPVASSVLIDHCTNSTLAFLCQQLRAIIENCSGVGFAPFTWSHPRLEEDFSLSGLDRERNNWDQVDDFNWLDTEAPSPNWTVIPEGERKNNWDP
uniref:Tubulin folding cofactor C n=1 Tax=Gouania willdenowi TaxID=441366 RepID=A0A8C5GNU3_GOUWI